INGSLKKVKEKIASGMPVLGTCAGMILLSKKAKDRVVGEMEQPLLDYLDIKIERNAFGRQKNSFEADVSLEKIGIPKFQGVFIRAPSVVDAGKTVEVLSKIDEKIVAVRQGNIIGTSFHPELTEDLSLHKYFVNLVQKKN
ncbi:MAG TPA: pyridoxal 5'-phosphate synthase glutaminase subunit PdxT, partial [Candidatus Nitrosotalea sp.]|nr:pyridoxal 5'-phosphate synthase glutaminase subunit PdxT [Candidatus Nitrosotalea sp.]